MSFYDAIRVGASGAVAGFQVDRSLRFNSADGTGLTRTPSSAGNLKKWTWSGWVKRSSLGTAQDLFSAYHPSGYYNAIRFGTTDQLNFQSNSAEIKKTNRVFRDLSAWYHIVVAVDTQNATAADRVILYVNGERETSLATDNVVNLGTDFAMNSAQPHTIGVYANNSSYRFNGYLAEINFIDGQALTPASFGETDSTTGQWNPIEYTGTYTVTGRASDGTTWVSGSSNNNNQVEANAFNGIATTSAADAGSMYQTPLNGSYTVTPSTSITVNSNLSFQMYANVANFDTYSSVFVNGSEVTMSFVTGTNQGTNDGVWSSNFTGTLNNFGLQSHPTSINAIAQVIVDGSVLINGFDDDGKNSFYLQFADNSGTTATTLGKDTSGLSNNFTPSNFFVSGVGNDSLEDTPTNNFCTLNPLSLIGAGGTFSNGNLDFTSDSNYSTRAANFPLKTGKWYWECTPVSTPSGAAPMSFGIVRNTDFPIGGNSYIGYDPNGNVAGFGYSNGGNIKGAAGVGSTSGANLATGQTTYTQNDVIGLASDIPNGTLAFYKNGTLVYTITGINSLEWFPAISGYGTGSISASNFGQRAFAHTPPSGHLALNSKNLPNPAILFPNKHFDTVLYTGNGNATGSQTNVLQFQPDWFWTKSRNASYVHLLYDSVRGAGNSKALNLAGGTSPGTGAEGAAADNTTYGFLNSFDANGFSYTRGSAGTTYFNQLNINYANWIWNAGATDGATYTVKVVSDSGNKYRFNDFGISAVTLDLAEGGTYTFDGSDSSMSGHPFVIGTAANGSVYSTGVTYQLDGASVSYSAYTSGYATATTRKLIITVPASAPQLYYWCSIHSGMGGAINTNSTLGSSNFDGTLQATVKANPTAGFSIVTWTGNQTSGATLGHGLGVAPKTAFVKRRDGASNWICPLFDEQKAGQLNTATQFTNSYYNTFFTSQPSSTLLTIGSNDDINRNTSTYVAYVFSEVAGYSKIGRYYGNGNSDGVFVFTGFKVALLLVKRMTGSGNGWTIIDNKRDIENPVTKQLYPHSVTTEASYDGVDFLANGFKMRQTNAWINGSTDYYYIAFAESPFKNSRAR